MKQLDGWYTRGLTYAALGSGFYPAGILKCVNRDTHCVHTCADLTLSTELYPATVYTFVTRNPMPCKP